MVVQTTLVVMLEEEVVQEDILQPLEVHGVTRVEDLLIQLHCQN